MYAYDSIIRSNDINSQSEERMDVERTNKGGRPPVITDETVRKLEQCFQNGFSVDKSVQLCGIGRTTFYEKYNSDEGFRTKMDLSLRWAAEQANHIVILAIQAGDVDTAKWYLERNKYTRADFTTKITHFYEIDQTPNDLTPEQEKIIDEYFRITGE